MDEKYSAANARIKALEIAVSTIAEHLRNNKTGFDSLANHHAASEAAHINRMTTDDGKEYATEVVNHLKDLLHVPDA